MSRYHRIQVIDSHTAGEPTRVVMTGGPDLGQGPLHERAVIFRDYYDRFRSAVVNEPRGSDVLVGALLCQPHDRNATVGVIFFNNVALLNMCGHGTIGLIATLRHMGQIDVGEHIIETPVGNVTAILHEDGRIGVRNVPSFRYKSDIALSVEGVGTVVGDIAWGGNWFFLVKQHNETLDLSHLSRLTHVATRIRVTLEKAGITGADGGPIDHIELFGPPLEAAHQSRNFVLCPGLAYDRSPCGTGTSAKLACLAADNALSVGQPWIQEGILGTTFEATYDIGPDETIIPTIVGEAYITAEAVLLLDDDDPFRDGIA